MTVIIALAVLALDRVTKIMALSLLSPGDSISAIPGIFHLTLVLNNGTAFGLFKGMNAFFILISTAVITYIILYAWRNRPLGFAWSLILGFILGGASGNLFDRIKFGRVIDFLDFRIWPVFNVADSCITIGMILLAWKILRHKCTPSS
ncbi:MAG: signal peptidase II [Candidatus Omnitrophota bacterium]|jgi:signal peptidase II